MFEFCYFSILEKNEQFRVFRVGNLVLLVVQPSTGKSLTSQRNSAKFSEFYFNKAEERCRRPQEVALRPLSLCIRIGGLRETLPRFMHFHSGKLCRLRWIRTVGLTVYVRRW